MPQIQRYRITILWGNTNSKAHKYSHSEIQICSVYRKQSNSVTLPKNFNKKHFSGGAVLLCCQISVALSICHFYAKPPQKVKECLVVKKGITQLFISQEASKKWKVPKVIKTYNFTKGAVRRQECSFANFPKCDAMYFQISIHFYFLSTLFYNKCIKASKNFRINLKH